METQPFCLFCLLIETLGVLYLALLGAVACTVCPSVASVRPRLVSVNFIYTPGAGTVPPCHRVRTRGGGERAAPRIFISMMTAQLSSDFSSANQLTLSVLNVLVCKIEDVYNLLKGPF